MPGGWGRSHSTGRSCESEFRTTYDNMISPLLRQAHDWIELFGLLLFRRFLAHGLSITSHSPRGPSRSPQKPGTLQGPFRPFEPPWLPETSSRDTSFSSFSSFSLASMALRARNSGPLWVRHDHSAITSCPASLAHRGRCDWIRWRKRCLRRCAARDGGRPPHSVEPLTMQISRP